MKNNRMKIYVFEEGCQFQQDEYMKLNSLSAYFELRESNVKSNFVGFIIRNNELIVSFPKQYKVSQGESGILNDIKTLSNLLFKFNKNSNDNFNGDINDNFPLNSYLRICRYYTNYGLYVNQKKCSRNGYRKKINWSKTIQNSTAIVNEGNLIYFPFVIEEAINENVFLTDCMKLCLYIGYTRFGQYFNIGLPYYDSSSTYLFGNLEVSINRLNKLMINENNDKIKELILSITQLLTWSTSNEKESVFLTKNFDMVWQRMINKVLDQNLVIRDNDYIFDFKANSKNNFLKEFTHPIQFVQKDNTRNYQVRYDHVLIENSKVFLFDSKYSSIDKPDFDYKQFSYIYILKDYLYSLGYRDMIFFNALVYPTKEPKHIFYHLDTFGETGRKYLNDIRIVEHYLNMNDVINIYLESCNDL